MNQKAGSIIELMGGTNIQPQVDMDKKVLILRVDLTKQGSISTSGKKLLVGTTHGFIRMNLPGLEDIGFSVNVTRDRPQKEAA